MTTVLIQCATPGCGHSPFPAAGTFIDRARQTGETFFCPAGHSLSYGEGSHRREVRLLREQLVTLERRLQREREQVTRLRRACSWVGCYFIANASDTSAKQALQHHMRQRHGMPTLAQVQEAS